LEILECLGRGGMGVVYKARQKALNRFVALKILAPERSTDPGFAERFTAEARTLASLNHPNIVTIHDFGESGGFYHLVMEYVDGVNLRQAMTAGRFTPEQALAIVPPVCEALQYAHDHGVVHRDIKPENLLLDQEGRVKVADFGIAKLMGTLPRLTGSDTTTASAVPGAKVGHATLDASAAGTPQYMAPEHRARGPVDHRADIYSLGVVLYELLTGEPPGS
jgi:serine/threonine protein kinase